MRINEAIPEQTALSILPEKQERIEEIPRPIHQAATKQLIGTMAPDEVLCVLVKSENFKHIGLDFNAFLAVLREGDQEKICFVMQKVMQDLAPILRRYYEANSAIIRTVEIEDPRDFNDLASKTGVGAGTGKSNTEATKSGLNFNTFCKELGVPVSHSASAASPWNSLRVDRIKCALVEIPAQVGKIECAANSAARALLLTNVTRNISADLTWGNGGYSWFRSNCPQDIKSIDRSVALTAAGVGLALAPFTGGISALVGNGVAIASGVTASIVETGPSPWELSKYIDQHMPSSSSYPYKFSQVYSYENFSNCAQDIASDMRAEDPAIAFFFWGPTSWHYANVVAVKGSGSTPEGFMILDTYKSFEYRNYNNMQYVMYNDYKFNTSFCVGGTPNNYTIIRFHRK